MVQATECLVIGAGVTGLACAAALRDAGHDVLVLDKGRGIGGRMATRRVKLDHGEISFDHGAQYLRSDNPRFRAALTDAGAQHWPGDGNRDRLVGVPGMSAVPRRMAKGLSILQSTEVTALGRSDLGWRVHSTGGEISARRVVLTIPAPQARALLTAEGASVADHLATVQMAPCLTLMAAFPAGSPRPFIQEPAPDAELSWIAQDNSKPGRAEGVVTWVAQASADFSARHLEQTPDRLVDLMLPLLAARIGGDPQLALYAAVHRWRYAQAVTPLGQPFLHVPDRSLYLGGDWCLGARAEHGFASGYAIAQDMAGQADVA